MLKGVNGSDELARELSACEDHSLQDQFDSIQSVSGTRYEVSSRNRIYAFQRILLNDCHVVTVRKTRGDDIYAACGQLAGQVADRTKRSSRYSDSGCNGAHARNIARQTV